MSSSAVSELRAIRRREVCQGYRLLLAAALAASAPTGARAQCATAKTGFPSTTASGSGSAPANDTFINPTAGHSHAYVAQGTHLYCILNVAEGASTAGSPCPGWPTGGWTDTTTISNFPSPVVLSNDSTHEYIFLTAQDGKLYKIDAATGTTVGSPVDTRRGTCASDEVIATPSVQLYRFATSDSGHFQSDMNTKHGANTDLVIVATHTMCGDSTHNRVIAYYTDTMTVKWTFNSAFTKKVDFFSDGGAIDYVNDAIYLGTNLASGASQDSLFAISTIDGSLLWAGVSGSIQNRPQFANGKLYVATTSGAVQAYAIGGDGAGNALPLWATPAQMPGLVTRNIWYETRSGAFQGSFLAVDSLGNLRAYHDTGTAASILWTQVANNGSSFTSMPAVFPSQNKAYVGKADGRLLQIDLTHGAWGADGPVASSAATVGDPAVDAQASGATDVDTVTAAAASGVVTSFSVKPVWSTTPCSAGGVGCTCPGAPSAPSSCASTTCNTDPCMVLNCVSVNKLTGVGHCAANGTWVTNGTPCDDGNACTCDCSNAPASGVCPTGTNLDQCWNGHCGGNPICYSGCTCSHIGDPGCGTGNPTLPTAACCGVGGCVNFLTDPNNCGACGNACASGNCEGGACRGHPRCGYPTAATLTAHAANLPGADGIAFDNSSLSPLGEWAQSNRYNVGDLVYANGNEYQCTSPGVSASSGSGPSGTGSSIVDGGVKWQWVSSATLGACNAYLSSYRTGVASPIYQVSPAGTVTTISNASGTDLTPLNGIAVALQGNQAFAGLVNDPANTYSPELAISVVPSSYTRSGVSPAPVRSNATAPYNDSRFDQGPVGPAFDTATYDGVTNTKRNVYYANYSSAGDLYALAFGTTWTAAPLQKGGVNINFGARVTALAFGRRHSNDGWNGHRVLAAAYGTRVSLVDLDSGNANDPCDGVNLVNGTNDCIDLSLWTPPGGDTEGAPVKILSLAAHPYSGDFYAEVEDNHSPVDVYVLNIDPSDLSPRRQSDVCDDLHLPSNSFPIILGTGYAAEGPIAIAPDMSLIQILPTVNGTPTFASYKVSRQ